MISIKLSKNSVVGNDVMVLKRWVTGFLGVCFLLLLLSYDGWHVLIATVSVLTLYELFCITPNTAIRYVFGSYAILGFLGLLTLPWPVITLVWLNDTGAYLAGSALGGPKLCPKISPKKTWSGFLGGITVGVLGFQSLQPLYQFVNSNFNDMSLVLLIILSVAAHVGDLLESWLKRFLMIKDSGSIIPGHGGFLDRFDSLIGVGFVGAVLWIFNLLALLR